MDLPLFQVVLSEDEGKGVEFVSLVDRPAIKRNFLAFSERLIFAVQDEDKQIITGPVLVPDAPVYRNDENGEYYVIFDTATVERVALRFFKNGFQGNINTDHSRKELVSDSVFFESWLVDREKGKQPLKGFEDVPDGTWFLTAKINDADAWAAVKSGEYKGFSIEGLFDFHRVEMAEQHAADILQQLKKIVDQVTD